MSIEKPQNKQELVDRIVSDILYSYVHQALYRMEQLNYLYYARWTEIPKDDLVELFPDIHEGPESLLNPPDADVLHKHTVSEYQNANHVTPFHLDRHYGIDEAEVSKRFRERYAELRSRLHEVIDREFPELRMGSQGKSQ